MTTPPLPPGFVLDPPSGTQQSLGKFGAGNIDLTKRPRVRNADGSISTVRSMSANFDGREVLLPTVSDDGRIMSDDEAIQQYLRTGKNLGSFDTVEQANAYADRLHREQEGMYADGDLPPLPPGFELMPAADFSDVSARVDSTADGPGLDIEIVGGTPESRAATAPAPRATDSMSASERFRAGLGKSMVDTAYGIGQAVVDQASRPIPAVANFLSNINPEAAAQARDATLAPQRWFREQAELRREQDRDLTDTTAGSLGKIGGDIATMLIPGSAAAKAPTLAGRIAGNALVGTAGGALQPVMSDAERNRNALVGGGFGAFGGAAGEGLAAIASRARSAIDPTRSRLMELAKQSGIPLHISQISESVPLKTLASAAKYLPFSGANRAASKQQEAFNRAISRTFGADAGKLTDEVMAAARKRISDGYEQLYARNDVPINPDAVRQLVAVETAAGKRLTKDQAEVVGKQLDMILGEVADSGAITGKKYQALRTQIMKAEGPDALGSAVKELRQALDDIAGRAVGPEDAAALRQLRGEWANLKSVQGLLKQVAGASDDVRPSAVWPAIRSGSTKEMRDLARIGQTLLKNPIPDSGTPGRNIAYGLLGLSGGVGGVPSALGLLGTGAVAGRALNSNLLAQIAAKPGVATNALARTSPLASLAAVPLVVREPERGPDSDGSKSRRKDGR